MLIHRYFSVFRAAARGLEAQRIAMATASENIANASTTRTENGTPYEIKRAVHTQADDRLRTFATMLGDMRSELSVSDARHFASSSLRDDLQRTDLGPQTDVQSEARIRMQYDPTHPHADADGYVAFPDVNVVEEMARMMSANRIYEANLSAVQSAKEMIKRTLEI